MNTPGITTAELEVALGGMYAAPKDPDAPDFAAEAEPMLDEMPAMRVLAGKSSITVEEMVSIFGDLYTAPSMEEAA